MKRKYYIGVDLHTNSFTCCWLSKSAEPRYDTFNLQTDLPRFLKLLSKWDEVAVESTANAAFFIKKIKPRVKRVVIVSPGHFAIIGKSNKKTDLHDSYWLAYYLLKDMLPKARLKGEEYIQLQSYIDTRTIFVRHRATLIVKTHSILIRNGNKVARSKLIKKNAFDKYVFSLTWQEDALEEIRIIYDEIVHLNHTIETLEEKIFELSHCLYGYENLLSIKGIGPLTGATILAAIADIRDFPSPSHLSSYFGIVPRVRRSNETQRVGRITKAGSKTGRTALVQSTWVAIKYSAYLKDHYERLKARGHPQKAIIATARKLLTIIYHTLHNDWIFDDFTKFKYHIRNNHQTWHIETIEKSA